MKKTLVKNWAGRILLGVSIVIIVAWIAVFRHEKTDTPLWLHAVTALSCIYILVYGLKKEDGDDTASFI